MPDTSVTLGVDIGSSATKAVLLDPQAGMVASASRVTELNSRFVGWSEADPRAWWGNVTALVPQLLATAGVTASEVGAVACAGMVPAVLCLDGAGDPVRPALLQNDARATTEIAELAKQLADVDLLGQTGSVLSQQSVAPTVRWLRRHEPSVWAATRQVVGSYDWLAMALGARPHVEQNWALESGLFDLDLLPVREVWLAAGLSEGLVPEVALPGTVVGGVSAAAARDTGLRAGTPIVVGGADHVLSALGADLSKPGDCLVKLGGAGDILAVSAERLLDPRLYLDAHPVPGLWLPNGCMATSGSLLRWLQTLLGGTDLPTLDAEAAAQTPASLICLPYFLGEKSPLHDPDLRGAFIGLHLGSSRGDLHRAILEATAYGFRQHIDIFLERGMSLNMLRVTNGGSTSMLWKQILADVLQRPLLPVVNHPGASLGAAIAAGIGTGTFASWSDAGHLVSVGDVIEPERHHASVYEDGYGLYAELGPAVRSLSHALARRSRT